MGGLGWAMVHGRRAGGWGRGRLWFEGFVCGLVPGGGDTRTVKDELARCNVSKIFSSESVFAALCSDHTVVAWGNNWSKAPFFPWFACMGKQDGPGSNMGDGKGKRPVH